MEVGSLHSILTSSVFHLTSSPFDHYSAHVCCYTLPVPSYRPAKIAGIIRSLVASYGIQMPPDIATVVSITAVKVSADLSYADVSITAVEHAPAAVKFLASQKGKMRRALAAKLQSYRVPILRFQVDEEEERATRMDRLLETR